MTLMSSTNSLVNCEAQSRMLLSESHPDGFLAQREQNRSLVKFVKLKVFDVCEIFKYIQACDTVSVSRLCSECWDSLESWTVDRENSGENFKYRIYPITVIRHVLNKKNVILAEYYFYLQVWNGCFLFVLS